jgi:NADH dehydrogenase [ubiquinone] 1 alpha subcomplex assembly factor 3
MGALPKETIEFFRDGETAVEVLDTPNAVATYNILVQEGRAVAAAMILPIDESET